MKTKFNKESRNLMIAMLLGDGSINQVYGFRMTHCGKQVEYLKWKIKLLNQHGIKNCGLKSYVSTKGYKVGETYYYTRAHVTMFAKVLRRVFYKGLKKNIANRRMLNRLDARGLAIWFMDDGCIQSVRSASITMRIATCLSKEENQTIIDFFKEQWNIHFYTFSEGRGTYSIMCGTESALRFIDLIRPYVSEVPDMLYKISYNIDGRKRPVSSSELKQETSNLDEDMVSPSLKSEAVLNGTELTTLYEGMVRRGHAVSY